MSITTTDPTICKPNVGVYTNPAHEIWIADTTPSLESVKKGDGLREGQVTVGIKSTGICGSLTYFCLSPSRKLTRGPILGQISTFGMTGGLGL